MGVPAVESRNDRVFPFTRVLAVLIVPILVVAFGMLYLLPARTGELFAWPIGPQMTAMMLGAAYLGGAYFFTRVALATGWHTVALGFIPVSAFAGYLGIATLGRLHSWPYFIHSVGISIPDATFCVVGGVVPQPAHGPAHARFGLCTGATHCTARAGGDRHWTDAG